MGRKLLVTVVVLLVFAAAGAAFVLLSGDSDQTDTAQGTTTTLATSSTRATSSTVAPASTTAPPATTATTEAPAGSVPDSCGTDSAAILAAVNAGVNGARDKAQVDQCRYAAADPTWVAVRLVAKSGSDFDDATVLLHGGGGSWTIIGSGRAACPGTPQQVAVDLALDCAGSGGGL